MSKQRYKQVRQELSEKNVIMETSEEKEEYEKLPPVQDAQEESEDEDDTEEALEAQTIFVLMSKRFRLSRNARAQW